MKGNIREIIKEPNPILRLKAAEVLLDDLKTPAMKQLIADMIATMRDKDGAGLAAPQIKESLRLVVISGKEGKDTVMINPQITRRSWGKVVGEEGCLSVIDAKGKIIYGKVERHKHVTCQYFDAEGKRKKIQAENHLARVIQHELDHIDGILFIDKLVK
ncbi:MAG: peptide deformylase [Bacillota bacterium]